jgi:RNA polymerase sigma-70 factor (ECF subfamily)
MRDVLDIVRRLPRAEQEVLALCAWQGLDATDAAAALGLAPASVRARLSRARRRVATLSGDDHNVRPTVAPQERSPR